VEIPYFTLWLVSEAASVIAMLDEQRWQQLQLDNGTATKTKAKAYSMTSITL
jgi:hypothetical protein